MAAPALSTLGVTQRRNALRVLRFEISMRLAAEKLSWWNRSAGLSAAKTTFRNVIDKLDSWLSRLERGDYTRSAQVEVSKWDQAFEGLTHDIIAVHQDAQWDGLKNVGFFAWETAVAVVEAPGQAIDSAGDISLWLARNRKLVFAGVGVAAALWLYATFVPRRL